MIHSSSARVMARNNAIRIKAETETQHRRDVTESIDEAVANGEFCTKLNYQLEEDIVKDLRYNGYGVYIPANKNVTTIKWDEDYTSQ